MPDTIHVGYILKQYPRLSETFILNEILGLEDREIDVSIFSLRSATEGRFHPAIASVRGRVHYLGNVDKAAFLAAMRALPTLRAERLADVLAFLDRLRPDRQARLLLDAIAVADMARAEGVTHLHAHFLTVAAQTAHIVHQLTGLPYTVTAHAKDIYRHTVDWDLAARIGSAATAVVTVCDANLGFLADRLDGSGTRLVRIYNGLGPQSPPVTIAEREPELVLAVGRLVEKKGFDLLLDAVAELLPRRPSLRCVIIGDGDQRTALQMRAARLGIDRRVTFTGSQPQHEVSRWLRRARVMAAPCRVGSDGNQDALPTVLIEALGAGLPVVTTAVAGIPEIVDHELEGLIVEADPVAIASAMGRILDDPTLSTDMSAAGPLKVARRFDRSNTIEQLIDTMAAVELVR